MAGTKLANGEIAIHIDIFRGTAQSLSRGPERELPSLIIPERYRIGLISIGSMPEASFARFLQALKSAGPADSAKALAERIERKIHPSTLPNLEKMITALAASQEVRRSAHVEASKFAGDSWASLVEDAPELAKKIKGATFRTRLANLIKETDIHLTAERISRLRTENERLFCGARIMTDVRAAFEDDAAKPPSGVTIFHTLEIKYHDDLGRHREFYVALDENDLVILKEAIERAETKRKTLESLLKKADLKVFD